MIVSKRIIVEGSAVRRVDWAQLFGDQTKNKYNSLSPLCFTLGSNICLHRNRIYLNRNLRFYWVLIIYL